MQCARPEQVHESAFSTENITQRNADDQSAHAGLNLSADQAMTNATEEEPHAAVPGHVLPS